MNDSILGIVITFIVLGLVFGIVLSIGVAAQGGVELPTIGGVDIPQINAGTNTDIPKDGFYEYCYRMGLDC